MKPSVGEPHDREGYGRAQASLPLELISTPKQALMLALSRVGSQIRYAEVRDGQLPRARLYYPNRFPPFWSVLIGEGEIRLSSSRLFCIAKRDGEILYDGFAHDEG